MSKRVILAKKVDEIEIEVKDEWDQGYCLGLARDISFRHNLPVKFVYRGTPFTVSRAVTEVQEYLPGFAP